MFGFKKKEVDTRSDAEKLIDSKIESEKRSCSWEEEQAEKLRKEIALLEANVNTNENVVAYIKEQKEFLEYYEAKLVKRDEKVVELQNIRAALN